MNAAVDPDAMLMLAYARGDLAAFEALYARHRGMLYRFLLRSVRDPHRTDELFQETWSRVNARRQRPMAAPAPTPATGMADEITAPNASDTPAQELHKIKQLFAQRRDDEARQRLTTFQHAHPQWELPPELRARLHQP